MSKRYTPEIISELKENEIFVFGSNLAGLHGGGAARAAFNKFGAVWGQGVGFQGQSYAIPTMHGGPEKIKPYVHEFVEFAKKKGVEPNYAHLEISKPLLIRLVNAYIVRNILNDEGFFPLFERDDDITKKAIEVLTK